MGKLSISVLIFFAGIGGYIISSGYIIKRGQSNEENRVVALLLLSCFICVKLAQMALFQLEGTSSDSAKNGVLVAKAIFNQLTRI